MAACPYCRGEDPHDVTILDHPTWLIREVECRNAPIEDCYVVFLGEAPRDKYFYCIGSNAKGTTLGRVMFETLRIETPRGLRGKEAMDYRMSRFRKSAWLLDMFGSEVDDFESISYPKIERSVQELKELMISAKGRLPRLIIPAIPNRSRRQRTGELRFGPFKTKVFRAFNSDGDLSVRFAPIIDGPWQRARQVNKCFVRSVQSWLMWAGQKRP